MRVFQRLDEVGCGCSCSCGLRILRMNRDRAEMLEHGGGGICILGCTRPIGYVLRYLGN